MYCTAARYSRRQTADVPEANKLTVGIMAVVAQGRAQDDSGQN
jgi:hypothetical protein